MRLAVLQPGYLPWLGYFEQLATSDVFVHLDDVQYDKHGWRNRNRVRTPDGEGWTYLTVPALTGGRFGSTIREVEIDPRAPWAKKHWRTIEQHYRRAPAFEAHAPGLRALLLERAWTKLVDLDLAVTEWLARELGLDWTKTRRSSELGLPPVDDPTARLVALCRHFGVDEYYSGAAAKAYLDPAPFAAIGTRVVFQEYAHPTYAQRHEPFVSHLAAIDALFNLGGAATRQLLGGT